MVTIAPVNKIIPFSLVDGPGSRCAIFLQGCNIACAYCHNPETQQICTACGECVAHCPAGALSQAGCHIAWDESLCVQCDTCIHVCPHRASPKIRPMMPDEVFEIVRSYQPFIRGVTVSGGECMLHPEWLCELFSLCRGAGLGTLIDSNGCVRFSEHPELLEVTDGVMLDMKAWDDAVFRKLTVHGNALARENLAYLDRMDRIEELRHVVVPGWTDSEAVVEGMAEVLGPHAATTRLKLIKFRRFGVVGELAEAASPSDERMAELEALAHAVGFEDVKLR